MVPLWLEKKHVLSLALSLCYTSLSVDLLCTCVSVSLSRSLSASLSSLPLSLSLLHTPLFRSEQEEACKGLPFPSVSPPPFPPQVFLLLLIQGR